MLSDETFDCITAKLPKMVEKCVNTIGRYRCNLHGSICRISFGDYQNSVNSAVIT